MGQVNSVGIEMMYHVKYNLSNLYVFSRSTYIFVEVFDIHRNGEVQNRSILIA